MDAIDDKTLAALARKCGREALAEMVAEGSIPPAPRPLPPRLDRLLTEALAHDAEALATLSAAASGRNPRLQAALNWSMDYRWRYGIDPEFDLWSDGKEATLPRPRPLTKKIGRLLDRAWKNDTEAMNILMGAAIGANPTLLATLEASGDYRWTLLRQNVFAGAGFIDSVGTV